MTQSAYHGLKARLHAALGNLGIGLYSALGCLAVTSVAAVAALLAAQPLLFPSLGPTILMFFERNMQPTACPRNTIIGHAVAILAGWIGLVLFGLLGASSVLDAGVDIRRAGAAAVSLALTALAKHVVRAPHPPAGASTLIVSLGFMTTPRQLAAMLLGILLVTLAGWLTNRLLGVPMPAWRTQE